ncbi:MAG: parallel beta-helix repeat-containing protein, partial [bacterium]
PGEAAFVDFVGTPVADVSAFNYHGGQLPPEPFTYLMTKAGSPYHITDVIGIPAGVRMIIEPGVTLQFDADNTVDSLGHAHPADMKVEGRLLAVGTSEQPIVFTRYRSGTASQRPRILFFRDRVTSSDPIQSRVRFADILNSATGVEIQDSDVSISANLFENVSNGVVAGKNAASRVVGNVIAASSTGIYITSAATEVTRNQVSGGSYGIALQKASSLVEGNAVSNASEAGIWLSSSPLCVVNANTVRTTSIQSHWGIYAGGSNALISQNRVERTTSGLLYGGIYVTGCVSGSSSTDRLVLDHNTVQRCYLANLVIAGSDPVVRFNELSLADGGASASGYGVVIDGLGRLLPKQPLFLGNNLRSNERLAVAPDPASKSTPRGGGVLGSAEAGGGNYVADNASVSGPDATVRGSVDQVFDVTTPQLESVDAILSVTTSPVAGAGAPASAPKAGRI